MPQHPSGGQGQGAFLVNGHTALIYKDQPVGIGILGKSNHRIRVANPNAQVPKVSGNGFGRSGKHTMRFAVQVLIGHTHRGKKFSSPFTSSTIHRIKNDRTRHTSVSYTHLTLPTIVSV